MTSAIPKARSGHWGTPPDIVERAKQVMGSIALDPCANTCSALGSIANYGLPIKRERGIIPNFTETDGLKESWDFPTIWVNPPFGPVLDKWLARCVDAHKTHGSAVMAIMPASTETRRVQHQVFRQAHAVCFTARRVKFVPNPLTPQKADQPTKGHLVAYWGHDIIRFAEVFSALGFCLTLQYPTHLESWQGECGPCPACGWTCTVVMPEKDRKFRCRCGQRILDLAAEA